MYFPSCLITGIPDTSHSKNAPAKALNDAIYKAIPQLSRSQATYLSVLGSDLLNRRTAQMIAW